MIKRLFITLFAITLFTCDEQQKDQKILSESSGNINSLSLVVDNELWNGRVGEALRNVLAAEVDGLPQDEPLFSLNQIPPQVFSGFVTKNRTVLKIEKGKDSAIGFARNVFAKPQRVIVISGNTNEEIIDIINKNATKIVEAFKKEEIKEKQRRISKSLYNTKDIKENLGLTIKFPSAYRIAKKEDNFFWIRKDITTGTTNLMIFELPLNSVKRNDSLANQIIKIRDSIGKVHIPGPLDDSYMVTEKAYSPFLFETTIDDRSAIETKGIWDVKNAFMSGPFINYIIEDKPNNRLVVIEGFAFAPAVEKREYMFELEAIIRSLKFE